MKIYRCDAINCPNVVNDDEFEAKNWSRYEDHDLCPDCTKAFNQKKAEIDKERDKLVESFFRRRLRITKR